MRISNDEERPFLRNQAVWKKDVIYGCLLDNDDV